MEVVPTVVPKSLGDIEAIAQRFRSVAPMIQVDVTDGLFAPGGTWLPGLEGQLPELDTMSYEAHLMTEDPRTVGERFIRMGAWRIIGHVEAMGSDEEAQHTLEAWRAFGAKEVGVAILIDTPLERLAPLAPYADSFLVMSIGKIGAMGATFDTRGITRVDSLHRRYPRHVISVDGGVSEKTIQQLAHAGATRFAVGSAISKAPDPVGAYKNLLESVRDIKA
ncbi:MAG: hypothetical protein RIQ56_141 [Candidatus Parcubacteria bacterium]|jgi:ribulose-phosphate 3-epimerase